MSKIEWTEQTWNPVTGCTKISQGCKFCYAEVMAKRLHAMGLAKYRNEFKVTLHPSTLTDPHDIKKPTMFFVCSMSDLFHADVPFWFVRDVFDVMQRCKHHTFQVLTKRPERFADMTEATFHTELNSDGVLNTQLPPLYVPENCWVGTSVENIAALYRIQEIRKCSFFTIFLSCEPLLEDITLSPEFSLDGIDWVICGGESGPKARPMKEEWARNLRDKCIEANVPFFFKQWGGRNKKAAGRLLDGIEWNQMPNTL